MIFNKHGDQAHAVSLGITCASVSSVWAPALAHGLRGVKEVPVEGCHSALFCRSTVARSWHFVQLFGSPPDCDLGIKAVLAKQKDHIQQIQDRGPCIRSTFVQTPETFTSLTADATKSLQGPGRTMIGYRQTGSPIKAGL